MRREASISGNLRVSTRDFKADLDAARAATRTFGSDVKKSLEGTTSSFKLASDTGFAAKVKAFKGEMLKAGDDAAKIAAAARKKVMESVFGGPVGMQAKSLKLRPDANDGWTDPAFVHRTRMGIQGLTRDTLTANTAMMRTKGGATNAGMGMLFLSQGIEDAQYGFRSIVNNIAPLLMALGGGPGVAGVATIAAVALNLTGDKLLGLGKIMDSLTGGPMKRYVDKWITLSDKLRDQRQAVKEVEASHQGAAWISRIEDSESKEDKRRAMEERSVRGTGRREEQLFRDRLHNSERQQAFNEKRLLELQREKREMEVREAGGHGVDPARKSEVENEIKGMQMLVETGRRRRDSDALGLEKAIEDRITEFLGNVHSAVEGVEEGARDALNRVIRLRKETVSETVGVADAIANLAKTAAKTVKDQAEKARIIEDTKIETLRTRGQDKKADAILKKRRIGDLVASGNFTPEQAESLVSQQDENKKDVEFFQRTGRRRIHGRDGRGDGSSRSQATDEFRRDRVTGRDTSQYEGIDAFRAGPSKLAPRRGAADKGGRSKDEPGKKASPEDAAVQELRRIGQKIDNLDKTMQGQTQPGDRVKSSNVP